MTENEPLQEAILILPHLRVQNANTISGPMTWGFPSITAFLGFMNALARRVSDERLKWVSVGVICHGYEAQVGRSDYVNRFILTRNPLTKDGSTAPIVEEGRIHLDVTVVMLLDLPATLWPEDAREQLARRIRETVASMRIAGGSIFLDHSLNGKRQCQLRLLASDSENRRKQFRQMARHWLPGFALVSGADILSSRLQELQRTNLDATAFDAWLDLSRITQRATYTEKEEGEIVEWTVDEKPGWLVPIPVGYAGITSVHQPGTVANSRDPSLTFQFVETVYSIGRWVSPHRMTDVGDLLWYQGEFHANEDLYCCRNDYASEY